MTGFTIHCPIAKTSEDQRLVYGWASVIDEGKGLIADTQGHVIDTVTLQKAAHDFIAEQRNTGVMHDTYGKEIGTVVESIVLTADVQKALGIDLGKVGWFICAKIASDDVWKRIKSGELSAFSIGGSGTLHDIAG